MRDLIKRLTELRDNARLVAATKRPDPGGEVYMIGFIQGRHAAFEESLRAVEGWLNDEDSKRNNL